MFFNVFLKNVVLSTTKCFYKALIYVHDSRSELKLDALNTLRLLKVYISMNIDLLAINCDEEQIECLDVCSLHAAYKNVIDVACSEKVFLKQFKNIRLQKIATKYQEECMHTIHELLEKWIRAEAKPVIFNSNLEEIYYKMNWPNKVYLKDLLADLDLYECALLADCTKYCKESHEDLIKHKWSLMSNSGQFKLTAKHGYYGVAYFKKYGDHILLAIAHRGTQFNEIGNIEADINILTKKDPEIIKVALQYEQMCANEIQCAQNARISILHVGFSLGGYIAARCCTNASQDFKNRL